jgi:transcriptional regulator with XRE-family HTH domain
LVTVSPKQFAMRLKKLRESRGLTQEALAKRAGISRAYLARMEMGLHDPHLSRLRKLAKALKVKPGELLS